MHPQRHGERRPLAPGDQRPGVAVGQQPVGAARQQLLEQRLAVLRHTPAGQGVLAVQRPRLGQRRRRGRLVPLPLAGGLPVGRRHPSHPVTEVHRGGPRPFQETGRLRDVEAPRSGERHPVAPGDPEQRRPSHRQRPDRPHERGHVGAHQLDLVGGQPRLVEKHQHGTFRRLVPAKYGERRRLEARRRLRVLISHPSSLPGEPPAHEDTGEAERLVRPGPTRGTMAANLPPR